MNLFIKHTIITVLLFIILVSCSKSSENSDFNIKLDLVIKKDDSIHTFFMTDGTIHFNEINSFWTKVKGDKKNQKLQINFPKGIVPNQFRIDLGNNIKQEEIVLNKLECSYKSNSFVLKGKQIYRYLRVDESGTILEKDLGILKRLNKKSKSGPSLYPNGEFLRIKLEELTTKKNGTNSHKYTL